MKGGAVERSGEQGIFHLICDGQVRHLWQLKVVRDLMKVTRSLWTRQEV